MKIINPLKMRITMHLLSISICTIFFAHFLLTANDTYTVAHINTSEFGPTTISYSHLNSAQYRDYIKAVDRDYRANTVENTSLSYFNVLPSWSLNIIYLAYFLWLLLAIKYNLPPQHSTTKKPIAPEYDFEPEPDHLQEALLLKSMSDRQLEEFR